MLFAILQKKFFISAGSLFFPYSQHLKVPRKVDFEGVPLKKIFGKKRFQKTSLITTFTHAHIYQKIFMSVFWIFLFCRVDEAPVH